MLEHALPPRSMPGVGATRVAVVTLCNRRWHHQHLILLKHSALRTAAVSMHVLSASALIRADGLIIGLT